MTRPTAALGIPLAAGAATALLLGIYGAVHDPTGRSFTVLGFREVSTWKSGLASVVALLAVAQWFGGLRLQGRFGSARPAPAWLADAHRLTGTVAFGLSLPVAFHCLWALGYQSTDARILTHSLLGCTAYGLYAAKVLAVRRNDTAAVVAPVLGSLLGLSILGLWWGTALLHYTS